MTELIGKIIKKVDFEDDQIKLIHLSDGSVLKFEAIVIGGFQHLDYLGISTKLKIGEKEHVFIEIK